MQMAPNRAPFFLRTARFALVRIRRCNGFASACGMGLLPAKGSFVSVRNADLQPEGGLRFGNGL